MIFGRTYTKTIIWQNDVTSAPPPDASGPRSVVMVIKPLQPRPFRGQVILGAAAADIYFSGPCIATPVPTRQPKSFVLTRRQLQDGATTSGPASLRLVITRPTRRTVTRVVITRPFVAPIPVVPATFVDFTSPLTLTIDEIRYTLTLDVIERGLTVDDVRTTMEIDP